MKTFKFFFLMAVPVVLLSCSQPGNKNIENNTTPKSGNKSNTTRDKDTVSKSSLLPSISFGDQQDNKDINFLKAAANGGLMEVELGKYAEQNAQNPRVKKFGAMMVKDHQKANDELKSLASDKNIIIPSQVEGSHKDKLEDMQKMQGADFDKAYIKDMVSDHEKDVEEFQKIAEDGKDPEIKSFAAKTLPVLLMHLDSAKSIHESIK